MNRRWLTIVLLLSVLTAMPVPAWAGGPVLGKNPLPGLVTRLYGDLGVEWSKWGYAGPSGQNALEDTTGEFCDENQPKSKIWFLAGTRGKVGVVERTCTIPPNRTLFYPVVNTVWVDCPGTDEELLTDEEVRDILATATAGGDRACRLSSTLDGVAVSSLELPIVRTQSRRFTIDMPPNNVFTGCFSDPSAPLPPGETGRSIVEGYWVMLPPLPPGPHTLTLHGAGCNPSTGQVTFETGVTYHLNVLANPR